MSEQLNDKHQAAMRLFGALSGVDEKYLAACEMDKGAAKPGGVVVFMKRFGKPLAAVLCLALLGIGYYSVQHAGIGADKSANEGIAYTMDAAVQQECAAEEAEMMDMDGAGSGAGLEEDMEPEEQKSTSLASDSAEPGATRNEESGETETLDELKEMVSSQINDMSGSTIEKYRAQSDAYLAEAQALEKVGPYVPTQWPAEGGVMQLISSRRDGAGGAPAAWLFWSYDYKTEGFSVRVDWYEGFDQEWLKQEIAEGDVVYEEDYTREYAESRMKPAADAVGGPTVAEGEVLEGHFGVIYETGEGYALVRFDGIGTMDEIWAMMQ